MLHLLWPSLLDVVDNLGSSLRGLCFLECSELGLVQHHLTSPQSIVARLRHFASLVKFRYGSIHIAHHWNVLGDLFDWVNDRIKTVGEVSPESHSIVCVWVLCVGGVVNQ